MIKYESDCVDCGLPCIGVACRYYSSPHYYCDKCGEETDELYADFNGMEVCSECFTFIR